MWESFKHRYLCSILMGGMLCLAACANDNRPDIPGAVSNAVDTTAVDTNIAVQDTVRFNYLALGDSYTIGTGLSDPSGRWPNQLATKLNTEPFLIGDPPVFIAQNGWTTANLINGITNASLDTTYRLVSLLIGVNNQFQNRPLEQYAAQFEQLIQTATLLAGGDSSRIFVLSIPDYGVTPFGQNYDPPAVAAAIDQFNQVKQSICLARGISYFDITEISREVSNQPGMLAPDGLHPSAMQYALWVDEVYEHIKTNLND